MSFRQLPRLARPSTTFFPITSRSILDFSKLSLFKYTETLKFTRLNVSRLYSTAGRCYFCRPRISCSNTNKICGSRHFSADPREEKRIRSMMLYIISTGIFMLGATYAGVPLYRMFCQSTGLGGELKKGHDTSKVETMTPIKDRVIRVRFNADTASTMQWQFRPQQSEIKVLPGETALAFYRAKNPTDKPLVGISTYNVVPFEAGPYFNKIQCFCFEEQRLNPHEEVDMPVFFYIDPEFCQDPKLERVNTITLSYTFFEAKEGIHLPIPGYSTPHIRAAN